MRRLLLLLTLLFALAATSAWAGYPGGNQINAAGSGATMIGAPGNPGTTTSTTGVMAGLGSTCAFTPTYSTHFFVVLQGQAQSSATSDGGNITLSWGAGTAPSNGDALTITAGSFIVGHQYTIASVGTTNFTLIGAASNTVGVAFIATGVGSGTGTATQGTQAAAADTVVTNNASISASSTSFASAIAITGLVPGTAYWFDVVEAAVTAGTFSLLNVRCRGFEM